MCRDFQPTVSPNHVSSVRQTTCFIFLDNDYSRTSKEEVIETSQYTACMGLWWPSGAEYHKDCADNGQCQFNLVWVCKLKSSSRHSLHLIFSWAPQSKRFADGQSNNPFGYNIYFSCLVFLLFVLKCKKLFLFKM